jgi:hypothetical protein
MRTRPSTRPILLAAVGIFISLASLAGDALAVVGRPATPVSYAGAARRTVRRGG